jgi:hypothetical protein
LGSPNEYVLNLFYKFDMTSNIGILYGMKINWSEEPRDGSGVYEKDKDGYYNDDKYEGEIENGKPHGDGTWEMGNGAVYVGQWSNGRRAGLGTFTWSKFGPASGQSYEGQWKNNKRHGKGKMIYAPDPKTGYEGGVDEGYWVKNKKVIEKFNPKDEELLEGEELEERVKYHEEKRKKYSKMKDKDILN